MAIREVLTYPDKRLLKVAEFVKEITPEIQSMLDDMVETMYHDHGGGLAATQVDIHKRMFVMDDSPDKSNLMYFINPEIIEVSDTFVEAEEGCLSFPGITIQVKRPDYIKIRALDYNGNEFEYIPDNDYATRCVQHEIDHLEGSVFLNYLSRLKRDRAEKKLAKYAKMRSM